MLLNHTDTGTGYPVVLIHGFCESLTIWENITPELSKRNRVIAIDLPGFGDSSLLEQDITIEKVATEVFEFLQEKGIKECMVIGHSLGGYVTLALAESYPNLLSKVVLFHSTSFADTEEKKNNRDKTLKFIKKRGLDLFFSSFLPTLFANSSDPTIGQIDKIARKTPIETVIAYTIAMRNRQDRTIVLQHLNKPILIIAGREDNAVPIAQSRKMSQLITNSVLQELSVGHMGMYEDPANILRILKDFIKKEV